MKKQLNSIISGITIIVLLFSILEAQGQDINSAPVCADENTTYLIEVNSGSGTSGVDYGCLTVTPNPTWFHFKIENPGNIELELSPDPTIDIDFICWGPFNTPNIIPEQLTSEKIIDCSYSASSVEYCTLDNSSQNEFYILMITNYSNVPGNLTIAQATGTGSLDCSILEPCYPSDTDCDGEVDIVDITNVAYLFDTQIGDDLFNEDFDLDIDGDIDIVDITMVAYDFGWTTGSKTPFSIIENNNSDVRMYFTESVSLDEPNTYETQLVVEGVDNLGAYEIRLNYEAVNINVISFEEGELLESTNRPLFPVVSDFENGILNYAISSLGSSEDGAVGQGSILKIKFQTTENFNTPFTLDEGQVTQINGDLIDYTFLDLYSSIDNVNNKIYSIQPNPFNNILNISFINEKAKAINFNIYDILGHQVINHPINNNTEGINSSAINLSALDNGVYFIKMEIDNKTIETKKIIKK